MYFYKLNIKAPPPLIKKIYSKNLWAVTAEESKFSVCFATRFLLYTFALFLNKSVAYISLCDREKEVYVTCDNGSFVAQAEFGIGFLEA